jgi:hypothetical protein
MNLTDDGQSQVAVNGSPMRIPRQFVRMAWASEAAHTRWSKRLRDVAKAVRFLQYQASLSDRRPRLLLGGDCSFFGTGGRQFFVPKGDGLWLCRLPHIDEGFPGSELGGRLVAGELSVLRGLVRAWSLQKTEYCLSLVGFPECCSLSMLANEPSRGSTDPVWRMAIGGGSRLQDGKDTPRSVHIRGSDVKYSILLYRLGIASVDHFPCSFTCSLSEDRFQMLLTSGRRAGFVSHMDVLKETSEWPYKWSTLHGITEIQTPILKLLHDASPARQKFTVIIQGERYPSESVGGLAFPYLTPRRLLRADPAVPSVAREPDYSWIRQ